MRLRRVGTKGRPFYRVVVAPSTGGRNGRFVETLGTYDPVSKPIRININEERALHWLLQGAQPTETTAIVLNRAGVLDKYFEARPSAKKDFKFLDKRTSLTSKASAVTTTPAPEPKAKAAPAPVAAPEPAVEEVVAEAPAAEEPAVAEEVAAVEEVPAAEEAPAEAPAVEEAPAEEAPAEEKAE